MFPKNSGTPKSSILIGFSIINHPFWGTTILGNTQIYIYIHMMMWRSKPSPVKKMYEGKMHMVRLEGTTYAKTCCKTTGREDWKRDCLHFCCFWREIQCSTLGISIKLGTELSESILLSLKIFTRPKTKHGKWTPCSVLLDSKSERVHDYC